MNNEYYMRRAIELAKNGEGFTSPNPLVGAVIVKNGEIIGEGFHQKYGDLHAERNALKNCTQDPKGATMYVTLEPCCHTGKQPPCTEAVIASGISRVIIGSRDPNPLVSGRGTGILRESGIEVTEDFLRNECDSLNPIFFKYITTGLPYVALKYAMTADGKTATVTGASKWITGEKTREHVHALRRKYRGILVGIGTVAADNPELTCRIENGRNPVRIVCDSTLKIPLDCNICKTACKIETIIAYVNDSDNKAPSLNKLGVKIVKVPGISSKVDLNALMKILGKNGIDSVLIEGGGSLAYSAFSAGIVDRVYAYVAPKIFGGAGAKTPVGGEGVNLPDNCFKLKKTALTEFDGDLLIEYDVLR